MSFASLSYHSKLNTLLLSSQKLHDLIQSFFSQLSTFLTKKNSYNLQEFTLYHQKILKNKEKIIRIIEETIIKSQLLSLKNLLSNKKTYQIVSQKSVKIQESYLKLLFILEKGSKILKTNINFPQNFLQKSQENHLSEAEFMNIASRIDKQYLLPTHIKNKGKLPLNFLNPFPSQEEINAVSFRHNFCLSKKSMLEPPLIYPEENRVKTGEILKFVYDTQMKKSVDISDVFFKFSFNPNIIPSTFSGELYDPNKSITIDKNCLVMYCSCKPGYRDSIIKYKRYEISSEINRNENLNPKQQLKVNNPANLMERPEIKITTPNDSSAYVGILRNSEYDNNSNCASPNNNGSQPGTSSYQPSYYIGRKNSSGSKGDENEFEDEI